MIQAKTIGLKSVLLNSVTMEFARSLVKPQIVDAIPRVLDSEFYICISKMFPDGANSACSQTILQEPLDHCSILTHLCETLV